MNIENYEKAKKLIKRKESIQDEIYIWEHQLVNENYLAYRYGSGTHETGCLNTFISFEIFSSFKSSSLNYLKLLIIEIDKKIEEL